MFSNTVYAKSNSTIIHGYTASYSKRLSRFLKLGQHPQSEGSTDWGANKVGYTGEGPVLCCALLTVQLAHRSIAKKIWEAKKRALGLRCRSWLILAIYSLRRRFADLIARGSFTRTCRSLLLSTLSRSSCVVGPRIPSCSGAQLLRAHCSSKM
jgi:hypothetical protein